MISARHSGNLGAFSEAELKTIRKKSVCIVGCGGLGGFCAHALMRFGIGSITLIDGDVFCESNLNRQLFSNPENLGKFKAEVCKKELEKIDAMVQITAENTMLDEKNALELLSNHDIMLDCLDNFASRIILEKTCETLGITIVHGAINGFFGQLAVISPGDGLMQSLYADWEHNDGAPKDGNPIFTPQAISAMQCSEALKILAGRDARLAKRQLLVINLISNDMEVVSI